MDGAAVQEKEDDTIYEGLDEFFNQELADSIDKRTENLPSAPSRTDPEADAYTEDGRYIPLVSTAEEKASQVTEERDFDEPPLSEKAAFNLNNLLNILTKGSSRLCVQYKKGATKKDLAQYTHKHDLVKGNAWQLLEYLAPLRRGDILRCCNYGDILYYTPFAHGNLFHNPLNREKIVEQETAEKLKLLEMINKERGRRPMMLRMADCENIISEFAQLIKINKEQREAIQILLQLHTHEKFNHEMVNYLRDNVATLARRSAQQDKDIQELKKRLPPLPVPDTPVTLAAQPTEQAPVEPLKEQ